MGLSTIKTVGPLKKGEGFNHTVVCASDKSLTHRAILFSSFAKGKSRIFNALQGDDCRSTMECMKKLGVQFKVEEDQSIGVVSEGMNGFKRGETSFDCGNSGTTTRLLMGLIAGIEGLDVLFHGDESLSTRPMARVAQPLQKMGADIQYTAEEGKLPLRIRGRTLRPISWQVDKASAQVKSALLLAALNVKGQVCIELPAGSRDHTEKILRKMGASCQVEILEGREKISFHGPFAPVAASYKIPVDPSSAAFFAVLALLLGSSSKITLPFVLDNPYRTGFLKVLQRMTAGIEVTPKGGEGGFMEPTLDVVITGGAPLHATDINADEVPTLVDEIPILAVAAMFADGVSRFAGLSELRVKESDRLAKTCELVNLAGGKATVEGDALIIDGRTRGKRSLPFTFDPLKDHRLAMAAAVLAKVGGVGGQIKDSECVAVSFPDFFELLELF